MSMVDHFTCSLSFVTILKFSNTCGFNITCLSLFLERKILLYCQGESEFEPFGYNFVSFEFCMLLCYGMWY